MPWLLFCNPATWSFAKKSSVDNVHVAVCVLFWKFRALLQPRKAGALLVGLFGTHLLWGGESKYQAREKFAAVYKWCQCIPALQVRARALHTLAEALPPTNSKAVAVKLTWLMASSFSCALFCTLRVHSWFHPFSIVIMFFRMFSCWILWRKR